MTAYVLTAAIAGVVGYIVGFVTATNGAARAARELDKIAPRVPKDPA
jgi:hypothetical protein